jgi:hypothetical protein
MMEYPKVSMQMTQNTQYIVLTFCTSPLSRFIVNKLVLPKTMKQGLKDLKEFLKPNVPTKIFYTLQINKSSQTAR